MININVGLLGHVDSGKTTLAKALSTTTSTACFDKNPQSQERGITLDLGFSSFVTPASPELQASGHREVQFTLVDCPGHASLIKTVLGGAQIIDIVILVIDVNKGVQTQTAECLVIAEILRKKMLVVLNKIDVIPEAKRESFIDKVKRKMQLTLAQTIFKDAPIIAAAALEQNTTPHNGVERVIEKLRDITVIPERLKSDKMIMSVDHCFMVKGKGTVLTGTILEGSIRVNDNVEIPQLKITKKVKTMQMFKREVSEAHSGDRLGVCVIQFDPKMMERGYACSPGCIPTIQAAIIAFSKVRHFKLKVTSNMKFHVTVGHITVIAKLTLFRSEGHEEFDPEDNFLYLEEYQEDVVNVGKVFALLEFEKCLQAPPSSLVIGSNLSTQIDSNVCRVAFYGPLIYNSVDANYKDNLLPRLKIYKLKEKRGVVQRVSNDREVIVNLLFKKETKMQPFVGLKVELTTGERGVIESSFGQTGKVKVAIPEGLKENTKAILKKPDKKESNNEETGPSSRIKVEVILRFKRYIYDRDKKIVQN